MAHQPETNASFPDPQNPQDQQGTPSPTQRPAEGARIVSPGHTTNAPTPQGAGDFLNLGHNGSPEQAAPDGSWLMDGGVPEAPQGMTPQSMPAGMQPTPIEPTSVNLDPVSPQAEGAQPSSQAPLTEGAWLLDEKSEDVEIPVITSEASGMPEEAMAETSWSDENAGPSFGSRWAPRMIAMALAGAAGAMGIVYMDGMGKEGPEDTGGPTVMAPTEALTQSTELVGVDSPAASMQDTPRIIRRATPEATGTEREPGELSIWASNTSADDGDDENHMQGGPEADLAASTLAALDALMANPNADMDGKVVLLDDDPTNTEPETAPVEVMVPTEPEGFWLASLAQPSLVESQTPFEVANEGMLVDLDSGPMASITDIGPITIETEVLSYSPANVPPMEFQPQLYMWPIGFLTSYEIQYQPMSESNQGSMLALETAEVTFTDEVILTPVESSEIAMVTPVTQDLDESLAMAESELVHIEIVMAPEGDMDGEMGMDAFETEPMDVDVLAAETNGAEVNGTETNRTEMSNPSEDGETLASVDPTEVEPTQMDLTETTEVAQADEVPTMTGPGNTDVAPFGEMPDYFDAETPNLDLEPEFLETSEVAEVSTPETTEIVASETSEVAVSETPVTATPPTESVETTEFAEVEPFDPTLFETNETDPEFIAPETDVADVVTETNEFEDVVEFESEEPTVPEPTTTETEVAELETTEFESTETEFVSTETSPEVFPQLEPWQVFMEPDSDVFPFTSEPADLEFGTVTETPEMGQTPDFSESAPLDPEVGPTASTEDVPEPGTFTDDLAAETTPETAEAFETNGTVDPEATSSSDASPEVTAMLERLADPAQDDIEHVNIETTEPTPTTDGTVATTTDVTPTETTPTTTVTVPEFDVTSTGTFTTEPVTTGTDVAPAGDDLLQSFADFTDGATELTPVNDWPEPTTDGTPGSANSDTGDAAPAKQVGILTRIDSGRQWTRRNPPEHLMNGERRMTTPNVGAVRVTLTGGDVFEGKLIAVGKGLVELETKIGMLTLGSARVTKIARLDPSQLDDSGTASRDGDQGGQERVRVHAPGGVFTGRQIARDGNEITLITDEGLRITLVSDRIEEFGAQKRVGLRRHGQEQTTVSGTKVEDVTPEQTTPQQDDAETTTPGTTEPATTGTPKTGASKTGTTETATTETSTMKTATPKTSETPNPAIESGEAPPAGWEN